MKKFLISFIIVSSLAIIIKYFISDYNLEYKVDGYNIKTKYEDNRFYFEFNGKNSYNFDVYQKRTYKKAYVKQIKQISADNYECIYPIIDNIDTYPLCIKDGVLTDYHLIDDEKLDIYKENKVIVDNNDPTFSYYHNLDDNTYIALWNYKGYIVMNGKNYENIELFDKDRYDNSLSIQIDNKIYMPNYDEEHEYSHLIELDIINKSMSLIDLNNNIDYDSYIVGNIKNKLYIFDNKYNVLYEVNLKKEEVNIIGNNEKGFVKYENGKFVNCSKIEYKINKITYNKDSNSKYTYTFDKGIYKTINDNNKLKLKITNDESFKIHEYNNELYYVSNNYLYKYTPKYGSEKIFFFFELNFNKDKTIYVYNK